MTLGRYISNALEKDPNADLVSVGLPAHAWSDVWTRSRGISGKNRISELNLTSGVVIPVRSMMTFFITANCRI